MKTYLNLNFIYYPSQADTQGNCVLYLRIKTETGKYEILSTGFTTPTNKKGNYFDKKKQKFTGKTVQHLNKALAEMISEIHTIYTTLAVNSPNPISAAIIKNNYKKSLGTDITLMDLFNQFYTYYQESADKAKKENTIRLYTTLFEKDMVIFLPLKYTKNLCISQVNQDFAYEFAKYLKLRGLKISTISQKIMALKTVFSWAVSQKLLKENPIDYQVDFKTFTPDHKEPLDLDTINLLFSHVSKNEKINQVNILFQFMLMTGLAYCDLSSLSDKDFVDKEGNTFLIKKRQKTGIQSVIPLFPTLLSLYESNKDLILGQKDSNALFYLHLQTLRNEIGIRQKLSSHIARVTFSQILLDLGINDYIRKKFIGHSYRDTLSHYSSDNYNHFALIGKMIDNHIKKLNL
jgi:site-specific recombinase XerD